MYPLKKLKNACVCTQGTSVYCLIQRTSVEAGQNLGYFTFSIPIIHWTPILTYCNVPIKTKTNLMCVYAHRGPHPKDFCRSWTEFDLGEFPGQAQNLVCNGYLSTWWSCSIVLNFRLLWASALTWNISDRISVCRIQGKEIHACNRKSSFSCVRTIPEVKVQPPQLCDNTIFVCMTECTSIRKWLFSLPSHPESGKT